MNYELHALVALLCAASVPAQSVAFIPNADASKDLCNGIPFGIYDRPINPWAMKFKYQTLVTPAQYGSFAPTIIRDLAFASCEGSVELDRARAW